MRINKIKVYLFSFASLFLSACETVPQVVVESQSLYTNREISSVGENVSSLRYILALPYSLYFQDMIQ